MTRTLLDLLGAALSRDPGRPVVTFYDEATGERVELSHATFDNWVSKIANLFADEIGLEPGDRLRVDLPTHWLGPAVVIAGWTAGLVLTDDNSLPDVRVVGPDAVGRPDAEATHVPTVACSLRPLGGRFLESLPQGWLDFAVEVPPQPDALMTTQAHAADDDAVSCGGIVTSGADLVQLGRAHARDMSLDQGGRVATDVNPADPATFATSLLAPVVADASVVLVVNASPDRRSAIVEQERVTCVRWSDSTDFDPNGPR